MSPYTVDAHKTLTHGTPLSVVIPIGTNDVNETIQVNVQNSAVSLTTGVSCHLSYSTVGANAYTASAHPDLVLAGPANTELVGTFRYGVTDLALRLDPLPISDLKLTLTNNDPVNTVNVVVSHETKH